MARRQTWRTTRWIGVGVLAATLGCAGDRQARTTHTPAPRPPAPEPVPVACRLPSDVSRVVLTIERTVVPHDPAQVRNERGEIRVETACPSTSGCVRVTAGRMQELLALFGRATTVRHEATGASPHYGAQWMRAAWPGGSCEVADTASAPVVAADTASFRAAWDAAAHEFLVNPF